jgi:hypothetical protein
MEVHFKTLLTEWFYGLLYGGYVAYNTTTLFIHNMALHDVETWQKIVTSAVVTFFGVRFYIVKTKHMKSAHKHEVSVQSYFDGYIIAGNELCQSKQYDLAIEKYQKALDLNFDNDIANDKINSVKFKIEASK